VTAVIKSAGFTLAGLLIGVVVTAPWRGSGGGTPVPVPAEQTGSLRGRIDAIEGQLRDERRRREALEAELAALTTRVDASDAPAEADTRRAETRTDDAPPAADRGSDESAQGPSARFGGPRAAGGLDRDARRIDRLVDGGFTPERAQWIVRRAAELRMQALQARYDAERKGEPFDPQAAFSAEQPLREALGDQEYEQYLKAMGRSTRVAVRDVLASSPAEQAGLQSGDQVVAYDGKRVFDAGDLNRLVLDGQPGEPVAVDVIRDGQPMQIYVPRGPLGITGGGRFRGRP
jgi:membrane-associated protease RseP (regulator of RpoE activity)